MRAQAREADAGVSEIARMLGLLPVVLPASGSCAPLEPSDLSFSGHKPEVAAPEIGTERLQTFPDIVLPMNLPPPPPAPGVAALLAPMSANVSLPWSAEARARVSSRRWPWALDALVVLALLAVGVLQSPLAKHPTVRPYAEATTSTVDRGWRAAAPTVQQAIASVGSWVRSVAR
jgi:hypothetical protein